LRSTGRHVVDAGRTMVIGVTAARVSDHRAATDATAHEAAEEVFLGALEIPWCERLVHLHPLLRSPEGVLVDQRRDRDRDPFLLWPKDASGLAGFAEHPIRPVALDEATAVVVAHACVGVVRHDGAHGRGAPEIASAPGLEG